MYDCITCTVPLQRMKEIQVQYPPAPLPFLSFMTIVCYTILKPLIELPWDQVLCSE